MRVSILISPEIFIVNPALETMAAVVFPFPFILRFLAVNFIPSSPVADTALSITIFPSTAILTPLLAKIL